MVMPDHLTPISLRTHSSEPVPMAVMGSGVAVDAVEKLDELSVAEGRLGKIEGHKLMKLFTAREI